MYPPVGRFGRRLPTVRRLEEGGSNWTMDYPRSDRHFSRGLRRLTRIHVRSVEQPVNLDDGDDVYDWPWLYGVEVGPLGPHRCPGAESCASTCCAAASSCATISTARTNGKSSSPACSSVFPDRPIVDIANEDPIFHTVYDLDDRYQVPGAQYSADAARTYEQRRRRCRTGAASTTTRAA